MQSFGNTAFLTFEAKGKKCIGFDHGGPLTKNLRAEGSGYPWLLRGILRHALPSLFPGRSRTRTMLTDGQLKGEMLSYRAPVNETGVVS